MILFFFQRCRVLKNEEIAISNDYMIVDKFNGLKITEMIILDSLFTSYPIKYNYGKVAMLRDSVYEYKEYGKQIKIYFHVANKNKYWSTYTKPQDEISLLTEPHINISDLSGFLSQKKWYHINLFTPGYDGFLYVDSLSKKFFTRKLPHNY